jgi:uncharacterized phiE125 gp8 family phage protein
MVYTQLTETGSVITLQELKDHLRILHSEQDIYLQHLLDAAVQDVKQRVNILPLPGTCEFRLKAFKSAIFPVKPVQSITEITYIDGQGTTQTLPISDYELVKQWPRMRDKVIFYENHTLDDETERPVTIKANTGLQTVPSDIKAAAMLIAGRMYEQPADPVAGKTTAADRLLRAYKY